MSWPAGLDFHAALERQAKRRPDGSYLVRPFGRLPPWVYQVDAATKDRLLRTQRVWAWVVITGMVVYAVVWTSLDLSEQSGLIGVMLLVLAAVLLSYPVKLVVLRKAVRAAKSRQAEVPLVDLASVFPPKTLMRRGIFFAVVALLTVPSALSRGASAPGEGRWIFVVTPALLGAAALLHFWWYYRATRKRS